MILGIAEMQLVIRNAESKKVLVRLTGVLINNVIVFALGVKERCFVRIF